MIEPDGLLSGIILSRTCERVNVLEGLTHSSNLASGSVLVDMVQYNDVCCVLMIDTGMTGCSVTAGIDRVLFLGCEWRPRLFVDVHSRRLH